MRKTLFGVLAAVGLTFTTIHSNAQTSNGLVAYYSFDDSTANDQSGNGHHGTMNGTGATRSGARGAAFYFSGSNYIRIPHDPKLNVGQKGSVSVSAWFKADSNDNASPKTRVIVTKTTGGSSNTDYILFLENKNDGFGPKAKWGTARAIDSAAWMIIDEPALGKWHHAVGTMVYNSVKNEYSKSFYIDGRLIDSGSTALKADSNTADLFIGAGWDEPTQVVNSHFQGIIDEVRIYDRALSATEIAGLYNFTGINEGNVEGELQAADAFPNPFSSQLNIRLNGTSGNVAISLHNALGQNVRTITASQADNSMISISTEGLPKGIYTLIINNGKSTLTGKVVKN